MCEITREDLKDMKDKMTHEELKQYRELFKKKIICQKCGRKLGKKSIEHHVFLCGINEDILNGKSECLRCINKGVKRLKEELSFAAFGVYDRYDDIDIDDFPGFRD
jgi:U3 small nucleolar RNA-associated protein 14